MRTSGSICRAAVVAAVVTLVSAAPARADGFPFTEGTLGAPVTYQGGTVMLTFLYRSADYNNHLFAFRTAAGGQLFDAASAVDLFSNGETHGATFSFDPGALWGMAAGEELIFGICTNVPSGDMTSCGSVGNANAILYSGAAGRNFDGQAHARVAESCANAGICGTYTGQVVAFEDIREVNPLIPPDHDYNDMIFGMEQFPSTTTPEPVTMSLLATGLVGIGAARRRRNRQG